MTIIMMAKVLCLFASIVKTPVLIAAIFGKGKVTASYIALWAVFTTAFIVMQWMI